jgi:hypothetical protein
LRTHFAQLNPRPTRTEDDASLFDGEKGGSPFTFFDIKQRVENEGAILKGEFNRCNQDIIERRKKALEEIRFIPENSELANAEYTGNVQAALTICDGELK